MRAVSDTKPNYLCQGSLAFCLLATDMTAAFLMGFQPEEVSTFFWAWKAGMKPTSLNEIEIRGAKLSDVKQNFSRPTVYPWNAIGNYKPPC
jgi:hypothetical protein